MSKQNDKRIHQNSAFSTRFNSQFCTNPNNPYLSNSVPFQPMPLPNHYFPPQQINIPYGMRYSNPHATRSFPGQGPHNNYYPDVSGYEEVSNHQTIPYSIPSSIRNFSNDLPNHMNNDDNHCSSTNLGDNTNTSFCNVNSDSRVKNSVLHASAQTFVPRSNDEINTSENIIVSNQAQPNPINGSLNVDASNLVDSKPIYDYCDSTRPKDYLREKGPSYKKNEYGIKKSNWKNKENRNLSNQSNYNSLNLENQPNGYNYTNGRNWEIQNKSLKTNVSINPSSQEAKSDPLNSFGENSKSKPSQQNRPQIAGYYEPNDYYGNYSSNTSTRRNNSYQKRQNFNPKKSEWRRSYDQPHNQSYNQPHNQSYNYYQEERKNPNYSYNYYNKKGPRKIYNYQNINLNDGKPKQARQKGSEHWQHKHYKDNFAQGNRPNFNPNSQRNISPDESHSFQRDSKTITDQSNESPSTTNDEIRSEILQVQKDKKEFSQELGLVGNSSEKLQRENLVDNLTKGIYECMVCCDRIRQQHAIWSCDKCYNCFHLFCIKKWAGTSQGEPGWRCPACQNQNSKIPSGYFCFCKKLREPEWNRREIPHSCGEVCGKKRDSEWCTHKCILLCHPGPCPDCTAFIKRYCQCGKSSKEMRCSQTDAYVCDEKCDRMLECGVHTCIKFCHPNSCGACTVMIDKECFCGKEKKTEACTSQTAEILSFSCNDVCKKTLSCGHHTCDQICHEGPCQPCGRAVETVTTCPCGKMNLKKYFEDNNIPERKYCQDPIPTCKKLCEKTLKCGTPGNYHVCKDMCHEGECPPCKDQSEAKCRCGFMDKKIPCLELFSKADEVLCEKQCKKLRQCGRHKCGMKCCIDIDHLCTRVCGRTLKCRQHKCQETCHRGNCSRCWETSFEELSCHCGASVLYPPISCGTEPPSCDLPCRRAQPCAHLVSHTCHADPKCPPCTTLVSKPCFGNHTIMKSTPCYVNAMSCGEQCAKKLSCGVHLCQKVCHEGTCIQGNFCGQKCMEIRPTCDHPCANTCHSGTCPNNPCKEMVTVSCICGNRKVEMVCSDNEREYKSMATSRLASELHSLNSGGSVNISQLYTKSNRSEKLKRLDCNEECGLVARNRQLALALQISNPDARESLGEGGVNLFSDSMKEETKKDTSFAQMVHVALNELVMKAKQSKQKSRSHSFVPMNRDKRRFIHEYSKYFGCQSQSYDEEPKKNVVVTAFKNMCRLPPMSVVAVIQKELGQRKVPGPVINRKTQSNEDSGTQLRRLEKNGSFEKKDTPNKEQVVIDYFDFS